MSTLPDKEVFKFADFDIITEFIPNEAISPAVTYNRMLKGDLKDERYTIPGYTTQKSVIKY